eukprot:194537-Rhodomonas_salina.3
MVRRGTVMQEERLGVHSSLDTDLSHVGPGMSDRECPARRRDAVQCRDADAGFKRGCRETGRRLRVKSQFVTSVLVIAVLLLPAVDAQTAVLYTISQLSAGEALCHTRVSPVSCDLQRTMSSTVLSIPVPDSGEIERRITQFADFTEINSPVSAPETLALAKENVLEYACNWNAVEQTCEYRCNHLYTFPPGLIADKMNSTR